MRVTFIEPAGGLTPQNVAGALALADCRPGVIEVQKWSTFERLLAYDWAMREHLSASDSFKGRRPRPHFLSCPYEWGMGRKCGQPVGHERGHEQEQ